MPKYSITGMTQNEMLDYLDADGSVLPPEPAPGSSDCPARRAYAHAGWWGGKLGTRMSIEALTGKKGYFINPAKPLVPATTDGKPLRPDRKNIPVGLSLEEAVDAFIAANS